VSKCLGQSTASSASDAYWKVLGLLEGAAGANRIDDIYLTAQECAAVAGINIFEDVVPALAELQALGVKLVIASSLSAAAVDQFLSRGLAPYFSPVSSRHSAGGVKAEPLREALRTANLSAANTLYLADTAEGIAAARLAGVQPILMMNDPDIAMKLTELKPVGGVISLFELPDFVRLVAAQRASIQGPA
jgi:phosphoglycolate phosphatase-like HAD superfamily hydrolase